MLTWFRKNTKGIMIAVVVIFVATLFYGIRGFSSGRGEGLRRDNSVIAKVNGEKVTTIRFRELINRLAQSMGPDKITPQNFAYLQHLALNQSLDFTLILSEAKKKVRVPGREVNAAVESIMQQQKIPSKRVLEDSLKRAGLTLGQFREMIKEEITVQKFQQKLQAEVRVTPDDLREVRASHILVSTESAAADLLAQLKKGGDFSSLAKKHSLDPGSGAKGGDLGYFHSGMMVPEFERAAFALKPGELSAPVKSNFGYHLIKLTDSRMREFPSSKEPIEELVLKEKQQAAFQRWYGEAKGRAKIEILDPALKANEYRFTGRLGEAVTEYKKAIAAQPGNAMLYIALGDTYLSLGQSALAIAEYENAVKVEGGNPYYYLILGNAYRAAGEGRKASEQFQKASLVAGDNLAAHEQLKKLFQEMKLPAEAARESREIERIKKREAFRKELSGDK